MLTIGTLSKKTGTKVQTIRYYEQIGLMPEPGRTEGGQRRYDSFGGTPHHSRVTLPAASSAELPPEHEEPTADDEHECRVNQPTGPQTV